MTTGYKTAHTFIAYLRTAKFALYGLLRDDCRANKRQQQRGESLVRQRQKVRRAFDGYKAVEALKVHSVSQAVCNRMALHLLLLSLVASSVLATPILDVSRYINSDRSIEPRTLEVEPNPNRTFQL